MKKFLIILLILLTTFTAVFADGDPAPEEPEFKSEKATAAFRTTAPAFATRANRTEYGLFVNPAALRGGKFQILVGADADIYNAAELLSKINFDNFSASYLVGSVIDILPLGDSKMLSAEADLFLGLGNFAFGVYANADVDASVGDATFVNPVIDGGVALGYGARLFNSDLVSVDAGWALHADATFVNSFQMGTANLQNLDLDPASILKQGIPLIGVSADAGVNVGFLKDHLVASVSFTDFAPFGCWAFNLDTKKILTAEQFTTAFGANNKIIENYKNAYKLNAGVSGNMNLLGFNATAFADVVDILGLDFKNFEVKSVLSHVNVGATLDFAGFIKASAALYGGDPEIGVGFDIFGNEVGLIYKISEGSSEMGQKTVDSLSVRVRLGFDTN